MSHSVTSRIYPLNKLVAVVEAMKREGIATDAALDGTGIAAWELASPGARMSVAQLQAAYRNALKLSRDPAFAVRLGQSTQVTTYGIYGYALLSSPDQRTLYDLVLKYHRLMLATADLSFHEDAADGIGIWTITPLNVRPADHRLYRFIVELYIGTLLAMARDILEVPEIRNEIRLTYAASPGLPAYERLFRCPVRFGQARNELRINTATIDAPTRRYNALTFATVRKICAETLEQMGQGRMGTGLAHDLQQFLLEQPGRFPEIGAAASRHGISPRTLRRRLEAEGTSYGALVQEVRIGLARKYLRETVMTIDDIAGHLGYSDASNFRRAFVKATQTTPTAYRRQI